MLDRAAHHEQVADHRHGLPYRAAQYGLAQAPKHSRDNTVQRLAFDVAVAQHFAADQQRPGGRIDEYRMAAAAMRGPVRVLQLVADQGIHACHVGHPQQGFGQTHQGNTLFA